MPSPFPGMDPFIESQKWEDFHHTAISVIRELLAVQVADQFVVNVEERVYVEDAGDGEVVLIRDVDVVRSPAHGVVSTSTECVLSTMAPVECLLPESEPRREGFLEIRTADGNRLITVIELLSPTNKLSASQGRRTYLKKRRALLDTRINLVELDLLRGGNRLPMRSPLPAGDYFALVSRGRSRPKSSVYAWKLKDRMPVIPIPLSQGVSEPNLGLQSVLNLVYDRAVYRLSLKYSQRLVPSIPADEESWLKSIVGSADSKSRDA